LECLFGALPEYFQDEDELRAIWSVPDTRKALLLGLAEKGFGKEQMTEMQKVIDAENSDLFDVLAYVAFALERFTRVERAEKAKPEIKSRFNNKQQAFLDFVLAQYVNAGVDELDDVRIGPFLELNYGSMADAVEHLGNPKQIREMFLGFQKYLYDG